MLGLHRSCDTGVQPTRCDGPQGLSTSAHTRSGSRGPLDCTEAAADIPLCCEVPGFSEIYANASVSLAESLEMLAVRGERHRAADGEGRAVSQCCRETTIQKSARACWSDLPTNLFEYIVNSLSLRDVRCFRLVCKEWLRCSNQTLQRLVPCAVRLPHVVGTFPSLRTLWLRSTAEKFEVDLTPVTKLNRLRSLNVQGDIPMSAKGLVTIYGLTKLRKLTHLVHLRMSCFQIAEGDTLRSVALLHNLRTLSLCGSKEVTDSRLKAVTRMTKLMKLNLSGCDRITSDGVLQLCSLPNLSALDVSFCRGIDDRIEEALAHLPQLLYLDISACWMVSGAGIGPVRNMLGLRVLKLSSCYEIKDEGLSGLHNLKNLEVLDVSACPEVGDATLKVLRTCQDLKSVDVSHCTNITDQGLLYLKELKCLTALNVSSCGSLSDAGMKAVAEMPSLLELDVGGSDITDLGVMHLCALKGLNRLHLTDCKGISDKGVLAICRCCRELLELHLKGCSNVSVYTISMLERGARVRIIHNRGGGGGGGGFTSSGKSVMGMM